MHLPLLKALIAVISASVLAIGVALASAGNAHHAHRPAATTKARTLKTDGLKLLEQLTAGNVKPDPALKRTWTDDASAVAHSLGLSDQVLAGQLSAGRSLAQIAASRFVPTSIPRNVLLRHLRDDLHRAEQDQALSPAAANSLLDALGTALGSSQSGVNASRNSDQRGCAYRGAHSSKHSEHVPAMIQTKCPGCGAVEPDTDGPVHKYVPSAPGCWQTFGEVPGRRGASVPIPARSPHGR
jgi:hypothetical protein